MDCRVCVICNTEKSIENFYNNYRECKTCNIQRSLKRYYENKDNLTKHRKIYYEKIRDMLLTKSKLKQQIRKCQTQQIKYLNNKLEEVTQALETFFLKTK